MFDVSGLPIDLIPARLEWRLLFIIDSYSLEPSNCTEDGWYSSYYGLRKQGPTAEICRSQYRFLTEELPTIIRRLSQIESIEDEQVTFTISGYESFPPSDQEGLSRLRAEAVAQLITDSLGDTPAGRWYGNQIVLIQDLGVDHAQTSDNQENRQFLFRKVTITLQVSSIQAFQDVHNILQDYE